MGKIIAVVSGKGGTGKTSFTANVGLALAALGCSTLCLDCDITLRNLDLALGLSDRALMDFTDVIAGRCTLEDAVVQHPKYPKLHLLTAPLSARPVPIAPEQMKEAVAYIDGRAETECSGNVTLENIQRMTDVGVDYISSGALTHSAPILDISLKNLHRI